MDSLAAIMTQETGKPISLSRNELRGLLGRLDFFLLNVADTLATRTVSAVDGMREQIEYMPLGQVACISAWNYPWFVGCNVLIPALLCGNSVLYKPSEYSAMTGLAITRLLHAAGVPKEVLACLIGTGNVGAALLQEALDGVFFTGSHATGKRIAETVGGRFLRLQLELGGKDPVYVCADANVQNAAASLADGAMYNTGQSCCSVERIYVEADIYEPFVAAVVREVAAMRMGDPMDEASYIGALTRAPQLAVLEAQVQDAVAKGAQLLLGGQRLVQDGNWFMPTVLSHVDHSMEVMREESFGPIIGIQKVAHDDEAVALMNDSRYGLTAGVFSSNMARAKKILSHMQCGSVYWNCCDRVSPRLPWSGQKDSGMGLTLSTLGITAFARPRAWHLRQT